MADTNNSKFCSRCGNTFDAKEPNYTFYEVIKHLVYVDQPPKRKVLTLCPDCKQALIKFMNAGK